MKKLSVMNEKEDYEILAYKLIKSQKSEFTFDEVYAQMEEQCEKGTSQLYAKVKLLEAFEFCIESGEIVEIEDGTFKHSRLRKDKLNEASI